MIEHAQIQIHFRTPGDWEKFLLTALWTDAAGYACRRVYHPQHIPTEYLSTLQGVIDTLVGLDEPWQATHVVAALHLPETEEDTEVVARSVRPEAADEPFEPEEEAVLLTINARRPDGGRRTFTCADYPALCLTDAATIAAFRHFTGQGC